MADFVGQNQVLSKNFAELHRGVKGKKPSLLNIVLELKKVCNHPFLFEASGYQVSFTQKPSHSSTENLKILS